MRKGVYILLIDEKFIFTPSLNQTHKIISFNLDREYESLLINFSYNPKKSTKDEGVFNKQMAIDRYLPDELKNKDVISDLLGAELNNLITLSLRKGDDFIGNYHNQKNNQEIRISEEFSSRGFRPYKLEVGSYDLILSFHNILTDVKARLKVALYE